jgi:hypothetical protein
MANFDRLRGVLADEEDPFLHGAEPMPEDEAPSIDHGDTSLARVAGLRQRPRLAADWREKAAEDEARKLMMAERLTPSPEMMSKVVGSGLGVGQKLRNDFAQPVPVVRPVAVSGPNENPTPVPTTVAATTRENPAPKAGASTDTVKPSVSPTSGGGSDDAELSDLRTRLGLQQAFEGLGSAASGKNLYTDGGILTERMKQIEALRAKKLQTAEDRALEQQQFEGANLGTLTSNIASFKDRPEVVAALENLRSGAKYTKPSDFLKAVYQAVMNPPTVAGKEAIVKKTGAQTTTEEGKPEIARGTLEVKRGKLNEDIRKNKASEAIRWAAMNRAAQNAATKLTTGQPEAVQKEVRATTQKLGDAIAKEYGEISSALKEADRSLVAIKNQPPDVFAKVMQATNLDGLNTPEERALFRSVGELRRAAQKAQSGLAVTENERAEFLQLFGANWLQSPTSLLEALEWMRRKTKDKLDQSFATYRAQGSVGNTAVQAYREAGGVTPDAEFLLPFTGRQAKTAAPKAGASNAPAPAAGGMVKVRHKASGKTATVDRAKADEMLKRPDFEEVK